MNLTQFKDELLRDDIEFKKEYEKYDLAFEIGQMIVAARIEKGLTQEKLANLVGTKQSGIARAERGISLPSLTFLSKIADALSANLLLKLDFSKNSAIEVNVNSSSGFADNHINISAASPIISFEYTNSAFNYERLSI